MAKITDTQIREFIKNINHNSDNSYKIMYECFARSDVQHKQLIIDSQELRMELILLRKDTNKIIFMALAILGAALGVSKIVGLFV